MIGQNDLSFGVAKLDYDVLLRTARVAVRYSLIACERDMSELHSLGDPTFSKRASVAKRLAEDADALAVAGDMLHVLEAGLSREQIELITERG